jgi:cyclic pyranopterin phosphate synthase
MPEPTYAWLPRPELLTYEEITRLAMQFRGLGVDKVRITGGEPLARRDVVDLVAQLRGAGVGALAMTTNGVLLAGCAAALKEAGLAQLTVSLDTLSAERFSALTRRDQHAEVLAGLEAAAEAGFGALKIDTVLLRGVNEDEIPALLAYAAARGAELRFIEYMDVGGATHWRPGQVISRREILASLASHFGTAPEPLPGRGSAPAERFRLPSGQVFGIIASTTEPFCGACDRARLTADGQLLTCLYATTGLDLRALLRAGATDAELSTAISHAWARRRDRGAEDRLKLAQQRGPLRTAAELRADPLLEMHRRGG